jgi:hypothetical protein
MPNSSNYPPELVKPDGAGYMPLYCAVQWIVTHGGTRQINPFDEALWREAYKALLDRIASEDVKVLGVRDGATETVSGIHFASCSVAYPFSDVRLDLILSKELCLISRPYLDDEHWRGGFDDSLEDRRGARWRRLMALKADVGGRVRCTLWKRNIVRGGGAARQKRASVLKQRPSPTGSGPSILTPLR